MYAGELEDVADLLGCLHAAEEGRGDHTGDGLDTKCVCVHGMCVLHYHHKVPYVRKIILVKNNNRL